VAVDEEGTEAVAATAVSMTPTSLPPEKPVAVRADRAFLFPIQDRATGTVLFLGHVVDASAA